MEADWSQTIIIVAGIFGAFLWLRNDIKNLRNETRTDMQQLRSDMRTEMQQFRTDIRNEMQQFRTEVQSDLQRLEAKVDGIVSRLRAVETEQSRIVGLLEGLGLAGVLPGKES